MLLAPPTSALAPPKRPTVPPAGLHKPPAPPELKPRNEGGSPPRAAAPPAAAAHAHLSSNSNSNSSPSKNAAKAASRTTASARRGVAESVSKSVPGLGAIGTGPEAVSDSSFGLGTAAGGGPTISSALTTGSRPGAQGSRTILLYLLGTCSWKNSGFVGTLCVCAQEHWYCSRSRSYFTTDSVP